MRFTSERVSTAWDELVVLAWAHHTEYGAPWRFDPRREVYDAQEAAGMLRLFTARDGGGKLNGYAAFTVVRHPHLDCLMAVQDTIYVIPAYRGFTAAKFMLWTDAELEKEWGIQQVIRFVPRGTDPGLARMGYTPGDHVFTRKLRG